MACPGLLTVRMRETRVIVGGLHRIGVLQQGREYALPKEFAAYLILEKKADFRTGRLNKFAPDQMRAPVRKQPVRLSHVLTLDE